MVRPDLFLLRSFWEEVLGSYGHRFRPDLTSTVPRCPRLYLLPSCPARLIPRGTHSFLLVSIFWYVRPAHTRAEWTLMISMYSTRDAAVICQYSYVFITLCTCVCRVSCVCASVCLSVCRFGCVVVGFVVVVVVVVVVGFVVVGLLRCCLSCCQQT